MLRGCEKGSREAAKAEGRVGSSNSRDNKGTKLESIMSSGALASHSFSLLFNSQTILQEVDTALSPFFKMKKQSSDRKVTCPGT